MRWDTHDILPPGFLPMLPTAAAGPLDSADYTYEVKWDGLRVLAGLHGREMILRTGAGQEVQGWFPELAMLRRAAYPEWAVLDGEVVVLDEDGTPSPLLLQRRLRAEDQSEVVRLSEETPAMIKVSDILRIGDSWLLDVAWDERKEIVPRAVQSHQLVKVVTAWPKSEPALVAARMCGLDSVIAKRLRGRYYPGDRTRDWLSIRPREMVDAVICGWMAGRGARATGIGALLLGIRKGRELIYIGHTGTGIDAETLVNLHHELQRGVQRACPFPETPASLNGVPHWVRPELICRIRFTGWTDTGKMRSPTFMEMVTPLGVSPSLVAVGGKAMVR